MERSKHPTFGSQRIPAMQLMAKVSTFTGYRKDELAHKLRDLSAHKLRDLSANTGNINVPPQRNEVLNANFPNNNLISNPNVRLNATAPASTAAGPNILDPTYKPALDTTLTSTAANRTPAAKTYHMQSEVGKLFATPEEDGMPNIALPGKRMLGSTNVSNADNAVIGGYDDSANPWQTTTRAAQEGEKYQKAAGSRKKRLTSTAPEDMISPITGNRVADYGNWAEAWKAKQAGTPAEDDDSEGEDADEDPLLKKLKVQLNSRGAKGILGLARLFRIMDDDGSNSLSFAEFRKAMKEIKLTLSEVELLVLFKRFDKGNTGFISYNSFLTTLAGRMNKRRRRLVDQAYAVLDRDGSGQVDMADIAAAYDVTLHPDFISGRRTKEQILREFLDNFDVGGEKDGIVTKEEFHNYYSAISASIQRDDYFELMIRNAWHISGGEGAAANSANRRVLVTRADGSQYVQEIGNDLGVGARDKAGLAARLQAQGIEAANIDLYGTGEDNGKVSQGSGRPPKKGGKKGAAIAVATGKPKITVKPPPGVKLIINKIKEEMKARGSGGFVGLQRRFRIMDDDGSKSLSLPEFKKALSEFKLNLTEADLRAVFSHFDSDGSGSIDFEEFVQGVRDPLSARRLRLVEQAFGVIDRDGSGVVDAQEVAAMYDASKHPEVIARRKTATQVLTEFLDTFDVGGVKDGMVTKQEFTNYYANIGASIDNDDYFELMIRNAWHLSGGEGWCANSTNMKVLITDSTGTQRTVEVQNDLGLKKDDLQGIYNLLTAQGVKDICSINGRAVKFGTGGDGKEGVTVGGNVAALNTNDFKIPKVQRPSTAGPVGASRLSASTVGTTAPSGQAMPFPTSTNQLHAQRSGLAGRVLSQMQNQQAKAAREQEEVIVGNTLLDVLRVQLLSRGAAGIIALQRRFADMDTDGSRSLDYAEFRQALLADQLAFSEDQIKALFNYFDADNSGSIDYEELLYGLRGQLPPNLLVLVHQIFDLLDRQCVDAIDPTTLITHFDASRHPEVQGRVKSAEQVQREFLDTFDVGGVQPGLITREEFVRYYTNISAAVNDDDYFEQILRNVWHINDVVSQQQLDDYQRHLTGTKRDSNSLANKLRLAQTMDAATSARRPSSAAAQRRPSDSATTLHPSARFVQLGGTNSTAQSAFAPQAPQAPIRPQSAGPMGRGRLNTHYARPPSPIPAEPEFQPVQDVPSGDVNEQSILQEARALQRAAVVAYNNHQYADAETKFRDVWEVMKLLFPATHPEVTKAEKSVQMVQRKRQQQEGAGAGAGIGMGGIAGIGGGGTGTGTGGRPRSSGGYRY